MRECVKRGRKPGRKSADKADVKAKLGNIRLHEVNNLFKRGLNR